VSFSFICSNLISCRSSPPQDRNSTPRSRPWVPLFSSPPHRAFTRRDGWHSSNCDSIHSLKSFSEDDQSSGTSLSPLNFILSPPFSMPTPSGVDETGLHLHSFQSHPSLNEKDSHVKMTLKAECVINKSKTLSVNDYTFLKTIGKVYPPPLPSLLRPPPRSVLHSDAEPRVPLLMSSSRQKLKHLTRQSQSRSMQAVVLQRDVTFLSPSSLSSIRFAIKIIKKNIFRDRNRAMKYKSRGSVSPAVPDSMLSSPALVSTPVPVCFSLLS
jgi:hypothetical protein